MECKVCKFNVSPDWKFCPKCGAVVAAPQFSPVSDLEPEPESELAPVREVAWAELPKIEFNGPPESVSVYQDTWAVIISISRYQSGLLVPHARNDTARFRQILEQLGVPAKNIIILADEKATMAQVVRLFSAILPMKVSPRNRLLFFYAGNVLDLPRVNAPMQPWFIPYDARSQDTWGTCLSGRRVFEWIKSAGVHHSFLVIDAASSGFPDLGIGSDLGAGSEDFVLSWEEAATQEVCQVLTAARAEQEIVASGARTIFMDLFANACAGEADDNEDNIVSGHELGKYVCQKVLVMTNGEQIATYTRMSGNGDVLFVPYAKTEQKAHRLRAPRARKTVSFNSTPSGATVFINHENRGTTPLELELPRGNYSIRVVAAGYQPFHGQLRYNGVKSFSHEVKLEARPETQLPPGLEPLGGEYDSESQFPLRVMRTKDEAEMVFVPDVPFVMGLKKGREEEQPPHIVRLPAFYIDRYTITNEQYEKFMHACSPRHPKFWQEPKYSHSRQPVVGICWNEARRYCEWAGTELPTEAEWEKAARATDGRLFPWGNTRPEPAFCCCQDSKEAVGPERVDKFPKGASPYGAEQMAGNVWEWCADWYAPAYFLVAQVDEPRGPETGAEKVIRGGAWNSHPLWTRVTGRGHKTPDYRGPDTGFRCVVRCGLAAKVKDLSSGVHSIPEDDES